VKCPHCSYELGEIELVEGELMFCPDCGVNVGASAAIQRERLNLRLVGRKAICPVSKRNIGCDYVNLCGTDAEYTCVLAGNGA